VLRLRISRFRTAAPASEALSSRMRKLAALAVLSAMLMLSLPLRPGIPVPVHAQPYDEELRQLLEKGLTLTELDREIERIGAIREETMAGLSEIEKRIGEMEIAMERQREKAGRVLRAYYMGDKLLLWQAFLSAGSLTELLRLWELAEYIFRSDRDILLAYAESYRILQEERGRLEAFERELAEVEFALQTQRERLLRLQREVDEALANRDDADEVAELLQDIRTSWQMNGLPLIREYFDALSQAMGELPSWLQEQPGAIEFQGLRIVARLTDVQMNDFLRSRDERFRNLEFRFYEDKMTIEGKTESVELFVEGHYTVENDPVNAIRFHIDRLLFNKFELPDTTRADLEREFDLGLYPQQMLPLITAENVILKDGVLEIGLRITF